MPETSKYGFEQQQHTCKQAKHTTQKEPWKLNGKTSNKSQTLPIRTGYVCTWHDITGTTREATGTGLAVCTPKSPSSKHHSRRAYSALHRVS